MKTYRVKRSLRNHFGNPPPVGTLLKVWHVATDGKRVWLEGDGYSLSVTAVVLRECFEEVN